MLDLGSIGNTEEPQRGVASGSGIPDPKAAYANEEQRHFGSGIRKIQLEVESFKLQALV